MENKALAQELLQEGNGVLRLAPAWVPRSFCRPGRRLKLHPDDYYALGLERGGIDERWFASTTHAENGPETPADEGLSYVVSADGSKKMLLKDMVELLQDQIIGTHLWNKYGRLSLTSRRPFASAQYCQNVFFHSIDYRASRFEFLFLVPFVIFSLCTHVQMFV